jgi:ParB-like chromosome segregation protein Spo0J
MSKPSKSPIASVVKHMRRVALTDLDPFKFGNPRAMTPKMRKALMASMTDLGFAQPIVVREAPDGRFEILNGHHRREVLMESGVTDVEVVVLDVPDDKRARTLALSLNRIEAEWNPDMLSQYIGDMISELDITPAWVADVTGFSGAEVNLLADVGTNFLDDLARGSTDGAASASEPKAPRSRTEQVTFTAPLTAEQNRRLYDALEHAKKDGAATVSDALMVLCDVYAAVRAVQQ